MNCQYCFKICKNSNSLKNHERLCKLNPNRQESSFSKLKPEQRSNQYKKAKELGIPQYGTISTEAKQKIADVNRSRGQTDEAKQKLSKLAKERNLGGHTSKQKIFFLKKDGTKVWLQSSYEIKFATILEELGIEWERPEPFIWLDEFGIDHRYYPDFKIGQIYIDTKNDYLAKIDKPKIESVKNQHGIDLRIVTKDQITKEFIALLV